MAELTEIAFGYVRGTFVAGVGDSADPGSEPDVEPMTGFITLNATVPSFKVTSSTPPVTVFPREITINLNADGTLEREGVTDVPIWATNDPDANPTDWQWRVAFFLQFDGKAVANPSFNFELSAGETVDLTLVAPLAVGSGGVVITQGPQGIQGIQGLPGEDGTDGAPGAPGAPGYGLIEYPSVAALDTVTTAEIGITPDADYTTAFDVPAIDGQSGRVIVETTISTTSGGLAQINQMMYVNDAVDWMPRRFQRVKAQFTPGVWEPWSGWYTADAAANESEFGVVKLATQSEAQGFGSSIEAVVQVKNLPQIAVSAATGNRIARRDSSGRAQFANPSANADAATKVYSDTLSWAAVPASATATGVAGARAYDASFLYICVATNTWRRVAIAAW